MKNIRIHKLWLFSGDKPFSKFDKNHLVKTICLADYLTNYLTDYAIGCLN